GSEFVVRLPLPPKYVADSLAPAQNDRPVQSATTRRILVVDDNRDAAESLATLLRMLGNSVRLAHDGPGALVLAKDFRPDVVLLDIGLPGMSGYDVCRKLRQQTGSQDVLYIAQTGWGQEEDRRRSREAGFDYHLVKPVDFGALEELLASRRPASSNSEHTP